MAAAAQKTMPKRRGLREWGHGRSWKERLKSRSRLGSGSTEKQFDCFSLKLSSFNGHLLSLLLYLKIRKNSNHPTTSDRLSESDCWFLRLWLDCWKWEWDWLTENGARQTLIANKCCWCFCFRLSLGQLVQLQLSVQVSLVAPGVPRDSCRSCFLYYIHFSFQIVDLELECICPWWQVCKKRREPILGMWAETFWLRTKAIGWRWRGNGYSIFGSGLPWLVSRLILILIPSNFKHHQLTPR